MNEITLSRIKQPPMLIGLFLAGLLLFAVVGVVRSVASMDTAATIQSSVGAGLQSIQAPAGDELPSFQLANAGNRPVTPDWLAVATGDDLGERLVWAGFWFSCMDITISGEFVGLATSPAAATWSQLPAEHRLAGVQRCMQEDVSQPLPVLPTATPVVHQWLDMITDSTGARWVWIGEWFVACGLIDMAYVYHNDRDVEAVAAWNRLPFDDQDEVRRKCRE